MAKKIIYHQLESWLGTEAKPVGTDQDLSGPIYFKEVDASETVRPIGSVLAAIAGGWTLFGDDIGGKSTSCGATTPVTGAPEWADLTPPPLYAGVFSWIVPYSAVTCHDGTIQPQITMASHPFLSLVGVNGGVNVYGNVPAGLTDNVLITLIATQGNGKSTPEIVTFTPANVGSVPIRAMFRNYLLPGGGTNLVLYLGDDFGVGNLPTYTLTGPPGFSGNGTENVQMQVLAHAGYFYDSSGYPNVPGGIYNVTFNTISGRAYGSFNIVAGVDSADTAIVMSSTPIVVPPDVTLIAPVSAAYDYAFNSPPTTLSRLQVYVTPNTGTGALEYAIEYTGPTSDYILPKSSYSALSVITAVSGYTLKGIVDGAAGGADAKIYIRRVGTTIDLAVFTLPRLPTSGTKALSKVWPAPGIGFSEHYIAT